jgi:Fe-S-cluster containining protein
MSGEYDALVAKVADFTERTAARRAADLQCKRGCDACCQVSLSVGPVEAAAVRAGLARLPAARRAELRERGLSALAREQAADREPRCAMLDDDGGCAIYAERPLVCRTQGHALRYPNGLIPVESVRARAGHGDVTWCPLNYRAEPPRPEDVLEAERVDQLLALVQQRYATQLQLDPLARVALSALAAS